MSPSQISEQQTYRPKCYVCKKPVKLEESKTDEYGQAVHEECYVSRLGKTFAPGTIPLADVFQRY